MAPRTSAKRSYRKRVHSSPCRSKGRTTCRATKRCKYVSKGKKRSFCRKVKNTKRHTMRRRSKKGGRRPRAHSRHRGGAMLPLAPHAFP